MLIVVVILLTIPFITKSDDYIEGDTLDIDGIYQQSGKTKAQQLQEMRKKLEKRNQQMIQNKVETMRYKSEIEMMKKLQRAMDEQLKKIDQMDATM
jgi:hypothetical protein